MSKNEALKLALEALESKYIVNCGAWRVQQEQAITATKEALAQSEPVAWSHAGAMPPEQEVMKEAAYNLAPWLSAALDDPRFAKNIKM
jgi:hypothetical protein